MEIAINWVFTIPMPTTKAARRGKSFRQFQLDTFYADPKIVKLLVIYVEHFYCGF